MPPLTFRSIASGLWVAGAKEDAPATALRRARGIHDVKTGHIRSRWGSPLVITAAASVHSLGLLGWPLHNQVLVYADGGEIVQNGVVVNTAAGGVTSPDGSRLTMVAMPPSVSKQDSLYIAGGGTAFVLVPGGAAQQWGMGPPAAPGLGDNGVGVMAAGTYQYVATFNNSLKGTESSQSVTASITQAINRQVLVGVPPAVDPQITSCNLYRTQAGGSVFFRLATNVVPASAFADNTLDANLGTAIPPAVSTVLIPLPDFIIGPYQNRLFWTTKVATVRGNLYFSQSAMPETVLDVLPVTTDSDPLMGGCVWQSALWIFSQKSLFQILGSYPYIVRQYKDVPGTQYPFTIKPTPLGIIYGAADGIRIFDGTRSRLVGFEQLGPILNGEAAENLIAFTPQVAEYHRLEYVASDGVQTLALNTEDLTWRDLGIGLTAMIHNQVTGKMYAAIAKKIVLLEDQTTYAGDAGVPIAFEVETPGAPIGTEYDSFLRLIRIEADTQGQFLTPTTVIDGVETVLPMFQTASRQAIEYPIGQPARVVGLRLSGSLTKKVEIPLIAFDIWVPIPEPVLRPAQTIVG